MECFKPADWFYQLFGAKEDPDSFISDEKNIISCKKVGNNYVLTSKINNLSYNAGNFQVRYIPSFLNDPKRCPIRNGGTFNILIGNGRATNKKDFVKIDAFSMQSLPKNDGATYLAASNFNCLEFVSSTQTAYSGVTNYVYDMTQGPYTALACPQSAVLRNYFIEFEDQKGNKKKGQLEGQINLLSKTPLRVENGYVIIHREELSQLKKSRFNWSDENKFAVGVHSNCEVLLKRGGKNNELFVNLSKSQSKPTQKVSRTQSHTPTKVAIDDDFPYDDNDHKEGKKCHEKTITKSSIVKKLDGAIRREKSEKNSPNDQDDTEKHGETIDEKMSKNASKQMTTRKNDQQHETKHHNDKHKSHHHLDDDDDESSSSNSHDEAEPSKKKHKIQDEKPPQTNQSNTKRVINSSTNDGEKDNENASDNSTPRLNIANHVYAASFNFNGDVIENDFTIDIASTMLKAEYKAAILSAWENSVQMEKEGRVGARKLYLTLLGGGVFGNPLEIIAEAIESCKDLIVKSGLKVYLICFDKYSYRGIGKILDPLVAETKGKRVFYE